MPNWFERNRSEELKTTRYRAVVPVDVWIDDTGNLEADRTSAHNLIKKILNTGAESVPNKGFNDFLQINDVEKYSNTTPF